MELLKRAVEIGELTDGAFDITVGPAVRLWKVTEATRVPTKMELAIAAQYVDYHLLRLDPKGGVAQWIVAPNPGPIFAGNAPLQMLTGSTREIAELLRQVHRWNGSRW